MAVHNIAVHNIAVHNFDLNLFDKLSLDDTVSLENRNRYFRTLINYKFYDISHEDEVKKYVINNTKFKDVLLIRLDYHLSKIYHTRETGGMVFYDKENDILYVLELISLKDKYSNTTDISKIENCITRSIKYSEYTVAWASKESIPVSVIELTDGKIQITERITLPPGKIQTKTNPWTKTIQKHDLEEINNDKWFNLPEDQTLTKYKINGYTLESERIVDYQPSSEAIKAFKKRVKRVCQESSVCDKYLLIMKDIRGTILMTELHEINEVDWCQE